MTQMSCHFSSKLFNHISSIVKRFRFGWLGINRIRTPSWEENFCFPTESEQVSKVDSKFKQKWKCYNSKTGHGKNCPPSYQDHLNRSSTGSFHRYFGNSNRELQYQVFSEMFDIGRLPDTPRKEIIAFPKSQETQRNFYVWKLRPQTLCHHFNVSLPSSILKPRCYLSRLVWSGLEIDHCWL